MNKHTILLPAYYASARLITEFITLEDEKRKVTYLNPFAEIQAPSIADHIVGSLLIGRALGQLAKKNKKKINQPLLDAFILWHDAPETRYGDIGRDRRKYIFINEDKARIDLFGSLPWGEEVISLIEKFEAGGEDIHVKMARDADALYVICTIKDFLDRNILMNKPEQRIANTLKRLGTDEAFTLGQILASCTRNTLWKTLTKQAGYVNTKTFPQSLMTAMGIGWTLYELAKTENLKNIERGTILNEIFMQEKKGNQINQKMATDANIIYDILNYKRLELKGEKKVKSKPRLLEKLQTKQGQQFGKIISEIDPFDWWQLMMGYAEVNTDGSLRIFAR